MKSAINSSLTCSFYKEVNLGKEVTFSRLSSSSVVDCKFSFLTPSPVLLL